MGEPDWPELPFAFNQSPSDTTAGNLAATYTPLSSSGVGIQTGCLLGPNIDYVDFGSFFDSNQAFFLSSGIEGSLPDVSYNNYPNMLSEPGVLLAPAEWPATVRYQQAQPYPATTTNLPIALPPSHHVAGQLEASSTSTPQATSAKTLPILLPTPAISAPVTLAPASGASPGPLQQKRSSKSKDNSKRGERYTCTQPGCHTTFGRPIYFRRHIHTKHQQLEGLGEYRCLVLSCQYRYPRADKVKSHMEKVHRLRFVQA